MTEPVTASSVSRRRVFVAGHRGMAGSALLRKLENDEEIELVLRTRAELDLTRQSLVEQFFAGSKIDEVYLAAAKVGGIKANSDFPADFMFENLQIQTNVISAAWQAGVNKLLFLGSSCIYPRLAEQPIKESALMNGALEPSNEAYAVAKIAGIKMCESYHRQYGADFRSVMPTNLYGPNDNFDLQSSHVLPALLRKFHAAIIEGADHVTVWGSGNPRREFMHVDDMAAACIHVMSLPTEHFWSRVEPSCSHVNVGTGSDISIRELAGLIAGITGFTGDIVFDDSMPDGTPRKLLDVSRLDGMGWSHRVNLEAGIRQAHRWMVNHWQEIRR